MWTVRRLRRRTTVRNTKSSAAAKTNTETSAKEDRDKDEKDEDTTQTVSTYCCIFWSSLNPQLEVDL